MKTHVQVVVIGGGVVGASVLYHLTKRGWKDVMLLERDELTSGSSWHAAGGMHTINGDPHIARLQKYTIELYPEIEAESGQSVGLHVTGGYMLAGTLERMEWLKMTHARGRYLGLETEIVSAEEAHAHMPLLDPRHFVGALWNAGDGHADPSGVTHAYAAAARKQGAEIHRFTKVEALKPAPDGGWLVTTTKGEIRAEHVVNAGGLWAREVGRMVGLELPILAMEHMYLITDDMPEVAAFNRETGREVLHIVDFEGEIYLRQEGRGMLMGTYERACKPWSPVETPWDFGHELLQPDLDRIAPSLEVGFEHFPAFKEAGIKRVVNGPFCFAPDGNPLVGPMRGLPGFWCACAVMAGFSQGGGVGLALANWIVDGDPGFDIHAMDVARYGAWATPAYTDAKVRENYSRRFSIRFPNEELPAARPLRTTPVHDRLAGMGAVFGDAWGLEQPLWFAPPGVKDRLSFRRSTDFEHVGAECRAVREGVGVAETSGFAKYDVAGPGAEAWLDRVLAGHLPREGRMALAPMLNEAGRLIGDFTLANLGGGHWRLTGSGPAEEYHMRWFARHLPADGSVSIAPLGAALNGLAIAGPKARHVLAALTREDVSSDTFRFMDVRRMALGAASALVGRVSYTGGLGYEIWVSPDWQRLLLDLLLEAGGPHGIRPFGSRALNGLRVEKHYGSWAREYRPLYGPVEARLDRFIAYDKPADFIGREAALRERESGGSVRLCFFSVDAADADAMGDEPIWRGGEVVGAITSGGYAHWSGISVACGYVPKGLVGEEKGWGIEILGDRRSACLQRQSLFDPDGTAMRG